MALGTKKWEEDRNDGLRMKGKTNNRKIKNKIRKSKVEK